MKKYIWLLALIITVSGCATTAKYGEVLDSWVGHNINELVDSWGYPSSNFTAPNGNIVYVYSKASTYTTPVTAKTRGNIVNSTPVVMGGGAVVVGNSASYSSKTTYSGGQTLNFWCTTYFEIDNDKTIIKWRWKGNACKSR